jgi:PAS domain S-box-containing protein
MAHAPEVLDARVSAALAQHRDHAIIVLDADGRVREWLAGSEVIFGWSADDMRGHSLERLFVPEDRQRGSHLQELEIATATGSAPDDRWHVRQDGSRFWAEGALSALRDSDGTLTGFVKVLRDRSESRGEQRLLENRVRALEEKDERRKAFLATLIHELSGPLAPLVNAMTMIEHMAPNQPDLIYPAGVLSRQIAQLRRLVEDLTEMARLGSGKLVLARETVDLNQVVKMAVESCRDRARARDQRVECLLPQTPILCPVDPARIQQVLANLITNASKYTPRGGNIWVQLTIEGSDAVFRIRDNGIGIQPEMQARIFDLFTQVPSAADMTPGGLGLGLPLVRELVHLHGGSVQVHSEGEHKGSEFVVKLPLDAR